MALRCKPADLRRYVHRRTTESDDGDSFPAERLWLPIDMAVHDLSLELLHAFEIRDVRRRIPAGADEEGVKSALRTSSSILAGERNLPSAIVQLFRRCYPCIEANMRFQPKMVGILFDIPQTELMTVEVWVPRWVNGKVAEAGGVPARIGDHALVDGGVRVAGDRVWDFVIPLAANLFARLKDCDLETVGEALFRCRQTRDPYMTLVEVCQGSINMLFHDP